MDPLSSPLTLTLTRARLSDARTFAAFMVQHFAESGRDGSPVFAPSNAIHADEVERGALDRWDRSLEEPYWGRAWLLLTNEPRARVVGHVELRGGRVRAEMHRAVLGMGLLRPYTGRGNGRRLIEAAIGWARDDARLSYLDLGVFSSNQRAVRFYERMGFSVVCVRHDGFRVDGLVVDDIQMTLALGVPEGPANAGARPTTEGPANAGARPTTEGPANAGARPTSAQGAPR